MKYPDGVFYIIICKHDFNDKLFVLYEITPITVVLISILLHSNFALIKLQLMLVETH